MEQPEAKIFIWRTKDRKGSSNDEIFLAKDENHVLLLQKDSVFVYIGGEAWESKSEKDTHLFILGIFIWNWLMKRFYG